MNGKARSSRSTMCYCSASAPERNCFSGQYTEWITFLFLGTQRLMQKKYFIDFPCLLTGFKSPDYVFLARLVQSKYCSNPR